MHQVQYEMSSNRLWNSTILQRHRRSIGLTIIVVPPLLVLSAAALYREKHRPKLPSQYKLEDLHGKTIIATGISSGIGKATIEKLRDDLGATVISGSRSEGNLDLSDLASIRNFCKSIKTKTKKCDIFLACAAEISYTNNPNDNKNNKEEEYLSVDGFDKTFATNHIGLQALLIELFENQKMELPSRIVIVGSKLERNGSIDPEIIRKTKGKKLNDRPSKDWTPVKHYGDTKLCNQLLVTALVNNDNWSTETTKIYSLSPGMVNTGLWRNFPLWFRTLTWPIRSIALRTPDDAAVGIVYVCASEEAFHEKSGSHFVDGCVPVSDEDQLSDESQNVIKAQQLWTVVKELIEEKTRE